MSSKPVDLVITWVDGHDPNHIKKLASYHATETIQRAEAAAPTRFNQCGELVYCLQSWMKYAPWIRYVFLVTDQQQPQALCRFKETVFGNKIHIIDHQMIFRNFEKMCPTFNSLTIETLLWRIPQLAEQFIYCNDDCFLLKPLRKEDFFRKSLPLLRGKWKVQRGYQWHNRLSRLLSFLYYAHRDAGKKESLLDTYNEHRTIQENSAQLAGFSKRFFHLPHIPFPLLKSQFSDYFTQHPQILQNNIQHRFRHSTQFWPISLMYHLLLQNGLAKRCREYQAIMINGATHSQKKILHRLNQARHNEKIAFLCVQSLDVASEETRALVFDWLKTTTC